jgi:hypothetical protein
VLNQLVLNPVYEHEAAAGESRKEMMKKRWRKKRRRKGEAAQLRSICNQDQSCPDPTAIQTLVVSVDG